MYKNLPKNIQISKNIEIYLVNVYNTKTFQSRFKGKTMFRKIKRK